MGRQSDYGNGNEMVKCVVGRERCSRDGKTGEAPMSSCKEPESGYLPVFECKTALTVELSENRDNLWFLTLP
jgi:hypothetical protein